MGGTSFEGRSCGRRASVAIRPGLLRGKGYGHRAHVALYEAKGSLAIGQWVWRWPLVVVKWIFLLERNLTDNVDHLNNNDDDDDNNHNRNIYIHIHIHIHIHILTYIYIYSRSYIYMGTAVVLLSGPSLAFWRVIIWAKFVFLQNTVCQKKHYKIEVSAPFFFEKKLCAQIWGVIIWAKLAIFKLQSTWPR